MAMKFHLESEFTLLPTLSCLFFFIQFVKYYQFNGFGVEFLRLYQSSGKEKESCYLVSLTSANHEIGHFHIVVMQ